MHKNTNTTHSPKYVIFIFMHIVISETLRVSLGYLYFYGVKKEEAGQLSPKRSVLLKSECVWVYD